MTYFYPHSTFVVTLMDRTHFHVYPYYTLLNSHNYLKNFVDPGFLKVSIAEVRHSISKKISIPSSENMVLVNSYHDALNSVFRSLPWETSDCVFYMTNSNPLITDLLSFLKREKGLESHGFNISLPVDHDSFMESFKIFVDRYPFTHAVLDSITYSPSIVIPLQDVITHLKGKGIHIIVDGSLLQDLSQVEWNRMDVFISRLDFWQGSLNATLVYASDAFKSHISPLSQVMSSEATFSEKFDILGDENSVPLVSTLWGIEFYEAIGIDRRLAYQLQVCRNASMIAHKKWNTTPYASQNMLHTVRSIELPIPSSSPDFDKTVQRLQQHLYSIHYWVTIFTQNQKAYLKITCDIYNDVQDFVRVIDEITKFL